MMVGVVHAVDVVGVGQVVAMRPRRPIKLPAKVQGGVLTTVQHYMRVDPLGEEAEVDERLLEAEAEVDVVGVVLLRSGCVLLLWRMA